MKIVKLAKRKQLHRDEITLTCRVDCTHEEFVKFGRTISRLNRTVYQDRPLKFHVAVLYTSSTNNGTTIKFYLESAEVASMLVLAQIEEDSDDFWTTA